LRVPHWERPLEKDWLKWRFLVGTNRLLGENGLLEYPAASCAGLPFLAQA
jgi:hypothetical protein